MLTAFIDVSAATPWELAKSLFKICITVLVAFLLYKLGRLLQRIWRKQTAVVPAGCRPAPAVKTWDPVFGIGILRKFWQGLQAHTLLEDKRQSMMEMNVNTQSFRILGDPVISTMEPQNIKAVLATQFKDFGLGDARQGFSKTLGEGIFTSDGAAWKHSRELLRPNFERAQFDDTSLFEKHAAALVEIISGKHGDAVDLEPLFFCLSIDVATEFLFGKSTDVLKPREASGNVKSDAAEFFDALTQVLHSVAGTNSKTFLGLFLPDWSQGKNVKKVHGFVDNIIAETMAELQSKKETNEKGRYIFLHHLLSSTQDTIQIRSELLNILLAGRDTTASLLCNIFFTLSQNPSVFAKLEEEILTELPEDRNPSFADLKNLAYLRAFINESLRLYPIVPENGRIANRDTTIPCGGGPDGKSPVFIPKDGVVHWTLWGMHRRQDLYGADAEEFRPERWLNGPDGQKGLRVGWEYLPFNGGPRVCIGQQFALMETSYVIVKMVRAFERIEAVEQGRVWREKINITSMCDGGVEVRCTPRSK